VPGGKSVYFQALNADGLLVQTMRDSTDFQAGERASCVGCHEHRSTAPAQGKAVAVAFSRPADVPRPLPGGRRGISFPRDIQPILDRRCVKCHDVSDPKGGAVLCGDLTRTFNVGYDTLVDQNRRQGHSLHTGPTAAVAPVINYIPGAIPPRSTGSATAPLMRKYAVAAHHDVKLPAEEFRMLAAWVDLNLPYYDDWRTKRYDGGRNIELRGQAHAAIADVLARRCASCHDGGRRHKMMQLGVMCNISRPKLSRILTAPMPKGQCGKKDPKQGPPFADAADADYQKILQALESFDVYSPPYRPLVALSTGE